MQATFAQVEPARLGDAEKWKAQKEYDKAAVVLEAILKEDPRQRDAAYQLGEVYRLQGKYAKAEKQFGLFRLIAAPGDTRAWSGLAQTWIDAGRQADAESFLVQELEANPSDWALQQKLSEMYAAEGKADPTLEKLRNLVAAHPESGSLHSNLGNFLRRKGDLQGAIEQFREALRLQPDAPGTAVVLGMTLEEAGLKAEAKPLYEKVLLVEPNNIISLNNLAYLLYEGGTDLDRALELALRARQLAPGVDTISDTLASVYLAKTMPDPAIPLLEQLAGKDPANALYHFHLAQAYLLKGDKQRARLECETGLKQADARPDNKKSEAPLRELLRQMN